MHPGKIRLTRWHGASVAFEGVIVVVIVVPERAAEVDGIVTDDKFQSAADRDAFRQINGKREPVGRTVVGVEHVAGGEVVERDPVVGGVTDRHLFAVAQVGHANDARHRPVLFTDKASAAATHHQ